MKKIWIIKLITFLSAFLLFQIELIIGKVLLPHYGGSYLVWGACIVFFQATLLLGYGFAHRYIDQLGIVKYRYLHLILLVIPFLSFPGHSLPLHYPEGMLPLALDVFKQLLLTVGLAFFVLSTMSIVWQVWLSQSELIEGKNPYLLFSVSNLGSFAALLSYPVLFELFFDLDIQQNIWRFFYFLLFALHIIAFFFIRPQKIQIKNEKEKIPVSKKEGWQWFVLSAASVVLFLAVTNLITLELASVPLFWIFPLSIYLLSFVLNFKKKFWCPEWVEKRLDVLLSLSLLWFFALQTAVFSEIFNSLLSLLVLFFLCMFCQRNLFCSKPKDFRQMTFFYFIVALGGFCGGVFVSWIAPIITNTPIEYLIGLAMVALSLVIKSDFKNLGFFAIILILIEIIVLIIWPVVFKETPVRGIIFLAIILIYLYSILSKNLYAVFMSLVCVLIFSIPLESVWRGKVFYKYRHRNYYGVHKVFDKNGVRYLMHGITVHGAQFLDSFKEKTPLAYYSIYSPAGKLLSSRFFNFQTIAMQGLGAGTLAVYAQSDQKIDFFELDESVLYIAKTYFHFLKNTKADVKYFIGDARLSLDKVEGKKYDLIISDVFGGDFVPAHMISKEALVKYRQHLNPHGLILFHISSRCINSKDVLSKTALETGAKVCYSKGKYISAFIPSSDWIIVTWDTEVLNRLVFDLEWDRVSEKELEGIRPWTDKYSSILPYIKWNLFDFNL